MRDETGRVGIIASRGLGPNGEQTPISYKFNSCLRTWYKGYDPKLLKKIACLPAQATNAYCTWHSRRSKASASLSA